MRRAWVLAALLATAAPAAAQAPGQTAQTGAAGANTARREQVKQKIRTLRAYALTEELALDERTGSRLWPVLAKWDDEIDRLLAQRVDLQRRLDQAAQLRDPRAIDRLIDDSVANQRAFWSVEERRLGELRKLLSPAQTARLLVVLPRFERKIQNQLRRAIVRGPRAAEEPDTGDRRDLMDDDEPTPRRRPRR